MNEKIFIRHNSPTLPSNTIKLTSVLTRQYRNAKCVQRCDSGPESRVSMNQCYGGGDSATGVAVYQDIMEQVNRSQILRQMRNQQKKINLPELGNSFNDFKILLDLPEWNELKLHDGTSNINISVYNTGENYASMTFTDNDNFIKFADSDTLYLLTAKNFDIEPYAVNEIMFVIVVKSNRAYVVL
ncbi:hypothetical protein KQX54_004752 [Cotesia glomerata]|uniref:Uncharacterized protein n=1 Tax=Cotesia glomerata TaxID=32391 RepID=A0AAV7J1B1_COTGL|nr:hypothetical protein KQX54_004752 [Cotesia glomerata]